MAETFGRVHLLTFQRFGFFDIENSACNIDRLRRRFPSTQFIHRIINIEDLTRAIFYSQFSRMIMRYGLFSLSNCLICGLVNHFAALLYCLDNKITDIADGSTRDWSFFPSHMENVILEIKNMYSAFGLIYHTPVYNFDLAYPVSLMDKVYGSECRKPQLSKNTTGEYLYRIGIFDSPSLKGTEFDHKMQPRCFQFILHHIYIYWYFMVRYDYHRFEMVTVKFSREKINDFVQVVKKGDPGVIKMIH